jgi:hypothetical protein
MLETHEMHANLRLASCVCVVVATVLTADEASRDDWSAAAETMMRGSAGTSAKITSADCIERGSAYAERVHAERSD